MYIKRCIAVGLIVLGLLMIGAAIGQYWVFSTYEVYRPIPVELTEPELEQPVLTTIMV